MPATNERFSLPRLHPISASWRLDQQHVVGRLSCPAPKSEIGTVLQLRATCRARSGKSVPSADLRTCALPASWTAQTYTPLLAADRAALATTPSRFSILLLQVSQPGLRLMDGMDVDGRSVQVRPPNLYRRGSYSPSPPSRTPAPQPP